MPTQVVSATKRPSSPAAFSITPETGACGASIHGLDLHGDYSPEVGERLVRALHEYGVLFVRFDGEVTPDEHKRLSAVFGELHESPFNKGDIPLVSVLDSEITGKYASFEWHTDGTVLAAPPRAASLRAIRLPQVGGDTMWASMYAAYEALSPRMQDFLQGLEALHSTVKRRAHPSPGATATHPVIIRNAITGRPALYVSKSYTERILGLSDRESASLLTMLCDHINTPDFHVRLKWDTQTIAIWEETVTQHRAINDYSARRILHRIVIKGSEPQAYGRIVRDAEAPGA